MDDRRRLAVAAVAAARLGYGTLLALAPRTLLRLQLGGDVSGPLVWFARAFGVRDALLGAGVLLSSDGLERRRWITAGVAADAGDLVATLLGARWLGKGRALAVTATAGAATATGLWALSGD